MDEHIDRVKLRGAYLHLLVAKTAKKTELMDSKRDFNGMMT
jgi:hypothetical protein